jgi:hypothetical protein
MAWGWRRRMLPSQDPIARRQHLSGKKTPLTPLGLRFGLSPIMKSLLQPFFGAKELRNSFRFFEAGGVGLIDSKRSIFLSFPVTCFVV